MLAGTMVGIKDYKRLIHGKSTLKALHTRGLIMIFDALPQPICKRWNITDKLPGCLNCRDICQYIACFILLSITFALFLHGVEQANISDSTGIHRIPAHCHCLGLSPSELFQGKNQRALYQ
jgi:hypothetical protein